VGVRALLWLALVLLVGCGGSNQSADPRGDGAVELPTPREDAESAAAKLIEAAGSGDCRRVAPLIHGDEGLSLCRFLKEQGALETIAGWDGALEVFGIAALGEVRNLDGSYANIVLALDPQREFRFITIAGQSGDPLEEGGGAAKVEEGIRALRDDDCEAFHRLSAQLLDAQQFCQASWVRDFQASVLGAERVSQQSLGGNGYVSFFAVAADRSVYNVTLLSWEGNFTWASAAPST
jgi:hypothetical protein